MRHAIVRRTSAFVPEREIPNAALRARFESSAPGAIDHLEAVVAGRVKAGDLVVLVASGVGFNQAAVALRVTDELCA